ncbi:MAG: outer membrane beta-barrel protein [Flavitalea sp.]
MDQNFYDTEFEELIKEKADQYKMYPSEKVWKGVHNSLHSRKKWYWSGFVVLLSGISYFAITELVAPVSSTRTTKLQVVPPTEKTVIDPDQLVPFTADINDINNSGAEIVRSIQAPTSEINIGAEDNSLTGSFEIPFPIADIEDLVSGNQQETGSLVITRPKPFSNPERFDIELRLPVAADQSWKMNGMPINSNNKASGRSILQPTAAVEEKTELHRINWLQEQAAFTMPSGKPKRISWQLAFSPTINYRKLTGGSKNAHIKSMIANVPMALSIEGNADNLVRHKPALGFELGTHGLYALSKDLTLRGGIQFNYSRYDIAAYSAPSEQATIALNNTFRTIANSTITNYSSIRNFGGTAMEDLHNQYFQLSLPIGLELRLLGNDHLQLNIAGSFQPTYLLNANTYLITTDYKNYTKEPSLVRKWNVNTGAEAYISYTKAGVKWQVGPQFRYQLFSSYAKEYPIKEYLMEYGIKIGITKTIR